MIMLNSILLSAMSIAKACAKATIECIYHHHKDDTGLDDEEIDILKDALQCLMYIKNLESDKH